MHRCATYRDRSRMQRQQREGSGGRKPSSTKDEEEKPQPDERAGRPELRGASEADCDATQRQAQAVERWLLGEYAHIPNKILLAHNPVMANGPHVNYRWLVEWVQPLMEKSCAVLYINADNHYLQVSAAPLDNPDAKENDDDDGDGAGAETDEESEAAEAAGNSDPFARSYQHYVNSGGGGGAGRHKRAWTHPNNIFHADDMGLVVHCRIRPPADNETHVNEGSDDEVEMEREPNEKRRQQQQPKSAGQSKQKEIFRHFVIRRKGEVLFAFDTNIDARDQCLAQRRRERVGRRVRAALAVVQLDEDTTTTTATNTSAAANATLSCGDEEDAENGEWDGGSGGGVDEGPRSLSRRRLAQLEQPQRYYHPGYGLVAVHSPEDAEVRRRVLRKLRRRRRRSRRKQKKLSQPPGGNGTHS